MPAGLLFGYGVRRLIDAHQRFVRSAHPVYYRYKNFADPQATSQAAAMGFAVTPGAGLTGTTDVLLGGVNGPPPQYQMISVHNIGMSAGKLRFGARKWIISQTITLYLQNLLGLANQDLVWRGSQIVGLVTDSLLFSIEDVAHGEVAGATVVWELVANANEIR